MASSEYTEVVVEGRKVRLRAPAAEAIPAYGAATRVVGTAAQRVDALEKVTGRAVYPSDLRLPGMVHARFVRSARAHARITSMDLSHAEKVPGFLAAIGPSELSEKSLKDMLGRELPILTEEPKYYGEEILAVCAETDDAARAAAREVRITYETLPFSVDPEERVRAGQFVGGGWTPTGPGRPAVYERGNVQKAMAAANRIIERTYRTAPNVHSSIEPHAAVASYEEGRWTVWESTQGVFAVREELAAMLGAPLLSVRVIGTHMGGGFGSKVSAGKYTFIAAYLAKKLGRPVRCVQDRSEEFVSPYGRPPSVVTIKAAVRPDGKLLAIEQKGIHAAGPYGFGAEWGHAEDMAAEMYACDNVRTETYAALTHTPPPCAMRAPGHAQAAFSLEQMMDEIAREIGMDPVEFRLKNLPARDPVSGKPIAVPRGSHGLAECLKKGGELFQWKKRRKETRDAPPPRFRRGVGVAATAWSAGGGPPASVVIRIHADGVAELFAGAADIGTGTRTALAQIASEETGVPVDRIRVTNADTALTSYCLPSYGSLTLASTGPAVRRAAVACRRQLLSIASDILEAPEKNIVLAGGRATRPASRKTPESSVPIAKLVELSASREIVGLGEREGNPDMSIRSHGAQFVAVEVDTETGTIEVTDLVAVNDSGRVINPTMFKSQQYGGVTMGLGMGLTEERVYDLETGRPLNPNLTDYKVPTILDQPAAFQAVPLEVPYDGNNLGAKGLGEPPIIPTAAAVANAVYDAIGIRLAALPLTPKRVIDALHPPESKP